MAKLSDKLEANRQQVVDYILNEVTAGGTQRVWDSPVPPSIWNGYNEKTQKEYSGANKLILAVASMQNGYDDPRWLTYKQAQDLGYQVKRGSKGVMLEFWKEYPVLQDKVDENGHVIRDAKGLPEKEPMRDDDGNVITNWRGTSFTVFNAKQIDGIEPLTTRVLSEEERNRELETIIEHSEAPIHWDSTDSNAYHYKDDEIHLRPHEHFFSKDLEYATAMHEIGHSTGHPSRLNRPMQGFKQDPKAYAREELIAEFTSAMLNAKYNLPFSEAYKKDNSVAYIQGWHELVKDNPNELFAAVAKAEQSVKYIEEHMLEPYLQKEQEQAQEHVATKEPVQSIGNEKELFKDLSITYHWSEGQIAANENGNTSVYIGPIANGHAYQEETTYTGMDAYRLLQDMAQHDAIHNMGNGYGYDKCKLTVHIGDGSYTGRMDFGDGDFLTKKPLRRLLEGVADDQDLHNAKEQAIIHQLILEEDQLIKQGKIIPFDFQNVTSNALFLNPDGTYDKAPTSFILSTEAVPTGEKYTLQGDTKDIFGEGEGLLPVYKVMNTEQYEELIAFRTNEGEKIKRNVALAKEKELPKEEFNDLSITFHHGEGLYRNENDELYLGPISHRHTYAINTTYEGKDAYTLLQDMAMHDKLTYESVRGLYDCPITINVGKDRYDGTIVLGEGVLGDGEKPLSTLFTKTPIGIEASKQHPDIVDALIKEEAQRIEHLPPLSQGIPNPQTQILVHTHGDSYDLIPPHHVLDVELTPTKESYHLLHCEDQGSIPVYELPEGMRNRYEQLKEANKEYHMFSTDVTLTEMIEKRPFKDLAVSIGFAELIPSETNSNEVYIGPLSDNHTYAKRTTYTGKKAYTMLEDIVKADEYRRNTVSTGYDKVDISIHYQDTPLFDDTIHIGSGELSTQHTPSGSLYAADAFKRLSEQRMGNTVLTNVKTEVAKMDSTHASKDNYDKAIYHIENEQSAIAYHWDMLITEEHMLATADKVKPFILADEKAHFRTPVVYINDGKAYDGIEADRIAIKTEPSDMVATKNGVPIQTYNVSDFSKASFTYDSEVLNKYKRSDVTLTKKVTNEVTATKEPAPPEKPKTIKRRIVLHQSSTKNKDFSR